MKDIKTLSKETLSVEVPDTPDILYTLVPNPNPASTQPLDQVNLEPYIRLKALPGDLRKIIATMVEAMSISERIKLVVPFLDQANPTYYPSGVVELQWRLDDGSVFGLILNNFSVKLIEKAGELKPEKSIKVSWRFHGPRQNPRSGEFNSVDEAIEFMEKNFVA